MKLLLKILVWPVTLVLSVFTSVCLFLFSRATFLLGLASSVLTTLAILVLLAGSPKNAAIVTVIAFLISPYGLPMLAARLIGGLASVNAAIKDFLYE